MERAEQGREQQDVGLVLQGWAVPQSSGERWWCSKLSAVLQCKNRTCEQRWGKLASCCSAGLGGGAVQAAMLKHGGEWEKSWKNGFLVLLISSSAALQRSCAETGEGMQELHVMMQCRARERESWAADPRAQVRFGEGIRTVVQQHSRCGHSFSSTTPARGRQYFFKIGSKILLYSSF